MIRRLQLEKQLCKRRLEDLQRKDKSSNLCLNSGLDNLFEPKHFYPAFLLLYKLLTYFNHLL
jgi:hypothetical protein